MLWRPLKQASIAALLVTLPNHNMTGRSSYGTDDERDVALDAPIVNQEFCVKRVGAVYYQVAVSQDVTCSLGDQRFRKLFHGEFVVSPAQAASKATNFVFSNIRFCELDLPVKIGQFYFVGVAQHELACKCGKSKSDGAS